MLFFSVLHNAVPGRSQESKNGDQHFKPFMEILAKMFRLFPFSQLRHHGPVHPFLPGNGSGGFID